MRSHAFVFFGMSTLVLAGLELTSVSALAQQGDAARKSTQSVQEEVTVVAPRIVRTRVRSPQEAGGLGYYDVLTLTHRVSYSDLNLGRSQDATMLENRINDAANAICQQLAQTPPVQPKSEECVRQAVEGAMVQARAAIAAAKK